MPVNDYCLNYHCNSPSILFLFSNLLPLIWFFIFPSTKFLPNWTQWLWLIYFSSDGSSATTSVAVQLCFSSSWLCKIPSLGLWIWMQSWMLQHWNWRYNFTQTGAEGGNALAGERWRACPKIQHLFIRKGEDSTSLEYLLSLTANLNFGGEMHPLLCVWPPTHPLPLAMQKIHYPTKLRKIVIASSGWGTVRSNRGFLALCS